MRQRRTEALWSVVLVCAVGLAVRLAFAIWVVPSLERQTGVASDPDRYVDLAASLLDRDELGFSPPDATPTSLRGPAFPGWLAAGMVLGGRSERWVAFWASVPGLLAALAIAVVLGRSRGRAAGLVGGLVCGAHPLACFVSARALPDEFYGAALLFGLLAWQSSLRAGRTPRRIGWALLAGGLLSAAAVTRVTAVALIIGVVAIALIARPRRILSGVAVLLVATGLLGAWAWRTSALVGRPMLVESLAGYNFWLGEAADRYGFSTSFGRARARAHELMTAEAGTPETASPMFSSRSMPPREARSLDERLVAAGLRRIGSAPLSYARRCAAGVLWFWIRAETRSRTIQYALVCLPLVGLGLFGLWRARHLPRTDVLPISLVLAVIVLHVAIYAAICPMARYSVQVVPLLGYLAGLGFADSSGARRLSLEATGTPRRVV